MSRHRPWLSLCLGVTSGCLAVDDDGYVDLASTNSAIVYGADDRMEVYEHPDARLRSMAASSIVSLIPRSRFAQTESGDFVIVSPSLREEPGVCVGERFADQPTAADCSGVLIDDDLVLTAGHCIANNAACEQVAFVFDYYYRAPGQLETIGWRDVYGCRRIVARRLSNKGEMPSIDYEVVQLDRMASGRVPVPLRLDPMALNEPLATVGCTSGLPLKVESGSHVRNPRSDTMDYFLLDSDTFEGSSGSGVLDAQARLAGVLVRGGRDYVTSPAGCAVPKVVKLSDPGGTGAVAGEEATYVGRAIEGLCATGWPSPRLCGVSPRCGDGFCSSGETRQSCSADCACSGADCGAERIEKAGSAGAVAKKSRGSGDGGCSLTNRRERGGLGDIASIALALTALLRRRRARTARGR